MDKKKLNRFRYIEAFAAVISSGSISAAAKGLGVSQPAVSQLIKKFELVVGAPLFVRRNGIIYPTARAESLRDDVEDLLNQLEKVQMQLNFGSKSTLATIRFSASTSLTSEVLPQLIAHLHQQKPNISYYVNSLPRAAMSRAILEGSVDFSLCTQELSPISIVSKHLISAPEVCVLRSDHALARKDRLELSDLHGQKLIMTSRTDSSYVYHRELLHNHGIRYQRLLESPMASFALATVDSLNAMSINNALVAELVCNKNDAITWRYINGVEQITQYYLCMPPWLDGSSTESLVMSGFYRSLAPAMQKLGLQELT